MHIKNKIINHILAQNEWMKDELILYKNKIIQIEVEPFLLQFQVDSNGQLINLDNLGDVDTSISMTTKAFVNMLTTKQKKNIKVDGDVDLANTFSKVILKTRWDIEEDLSLLVGDIAAVEISKFGKAFIRDSKKGVQNIAEGLVEYWQEEERILTSKDEVEKFNSEVDKLQEDFGRVEAKFTELFKNISR